MTSIGYHAFDGSPLTSITIGNSVTSIDALAFSGNLNLTSIIVSNPVPPTAHDGTFISENYQDATLYVPRGSLAAYREADVWKEFLHIEESDVAGIEGVQMDIDKGVNPIYSLQGMYMGKSREHLPAGFYIQGGKKFMVK